MVKSYDEATWAERAELFLNDGRNMLANAQGVLKLLSQTTINNNRIVPMVQDKNIVALQAQVLATMGQGYMLGGLLCQMKGEAGEQVTIAEKNNEVVMQAIAEVGKAMNEEEKE